MKRIITITVFCISLFAHNMYAQEYDTDQQLTQEAIKTAADFFVEQNMDKPLPEDIKQNFINDVLNEGLGMKEANALLRRFKKKYLTSKFYETNPVLEKAFYPPASKGPIACISEGFEDAVIGLSLQTRQTKDECGSNENLIPSTIDYDPDTPPANGVNFAIVNSGNDEIVAGASNGTFFLDRAKTGARSIRINQNLTAYEDREVDILKRTFKIEASELTFDFAMVMEDGQLSNDHTGEESYLRWKLFKGFKLFDTGCYAINDHRLINTPIDYPIGGGVTQDWVFSEWETVSINVSHFIGDTVTLSIEVADCGLGGHGGYAYIDNIESCEDEVDCCDLQPGFSTTSSNYCDYSFTGTNAGTICPSQNFSWTVNGKTVGNQETLDYTFPASGTYQVCYTICSNSSGLGRGEECCETYCEDVTVVCERICSGPQGCVYIAVEEDGFGNCTGAQANLICSSPDIDYVEWSWALNTVTNVTCAPFTYCPLPTDYSAPFTTFSTSWSGAYAGNNLYFKAIVHYDDGTTCEFIDWVTLTCDGSGGGGGIGLQLHPNPLKSGSIISFEGMEIEEIATIEVFDLYGNEKLSVKPSKQSFSVGNLTAGIYLVRFNNTNGAVIQKKLIID